jgi:eukaryotic-like serine/threonine-protein kinase
MTGREKYNVLQKLDAGGMAEVFLAEAESIEGFKKRVAIKRVLPELVQQQKALAMFLDEARLSLRFNHANVVHTFDVGRSGNTYFIVMEYVEGSNLKNIIENMRLRGVRFSIAQTLYLVKEVCQGLAYAHDFRDQDGRLLNVVHRDVSPPNILISRQGEVKIVDFGLAKAASQLETTDTGMVKGKFAYLSPEVAYGAPADFRADIFACGIILFELLTGERLFLGESDLKTIELVRACNVPSIQARNPEVTPKLEAIVRKTLERNPGERYASCHELADVLTSYLFENSLKVTPYDFQRIVESTGDVFTPPKAPQLNVIDRFIQEELVQFASLDSDNGNNAQRRSSGGAAPLDHTGFSLPPASHNEGIWRSGEGKAAHIYVPPKKNVSTPSGPLAMILEGERTAQDDDSPVIDGSPGRAPLIIGIAVAVISLAIGALLLYVLDVIP